MDKTQIEEFKKKTHIRDFIEVTYSGGFGRNGVEEQERGYILGKDEYKIVLVKENPPIIENGYPIFYDTIQKYEISKEKATIR